MSLGQTMITIGMLLLLIMSVISANRMINDNTTAQFQAQALASSATIANDLLLEIMNKHFDGKPYEPYNAIAVGKDTTGGLVTTDFTDTTSLGPSTTEAAACPLPDSSYVGSYKSITAYNDVDDYNGYRRIVNFNGINGFVVNVVVYYVTSSAPDNKTGSKTTFKKIQVTVSHPLYLIYDSTPGANNAAVYTAIASY
jgi:hypothetical protein